MQDTKLSTPRMQPQDIEMSNEEGHKVEILAMPTMIYGESCKCLPWDR